MALFAWKRPMNEVNSQNLFSLCKQRVQFRTPDGFYFGRYRPQTVVIGWPVIGRWFRSLVWLSGSLPNTERSTHVRRSPTPFPERDTHAATLASRPIRPAACWSRPSLPLWLDTHSCSSLLRIKESLVLLVGRSQIKSATHSWCGPAKIVAYQPHAHARRGATGARGTLPRSFPASRPNEMTNARQGGGERRNDPAV